MISCSLHPQSRNRIRRRSPPRVKERCHLSILPERPCLGARRFDVLLRRPRHAAASDGTEERLEPPVSPPTQRRAPTALMVNLLY